MAALGFNEPLWRTSSRSGTNGDCVQVATNLAYTLGVVYVRDSKDPDGGVLNFSPEAWAAFAGGVRRGEFDR